ncbi:tetratricopeptide repeat protein, partial [Candidatus Bathyarchaeota archaeon]|nr:tetratricopeptide repeat protein [Candidatus Bathyarchaeota archaeon]
AYLPDVAVTLNNLAVLHEDTGRHEDAEREYTEALEIIREFANKSPGCYRSDVAMVLFNIACLHARQENVNLAIECLSQAIDMEGSWRGKAREDADFDAIREDPRFKVLVGGSDGDGNGDRDDPGENSL